jgi:hypothetical protein
MAQNRPTKSFRAGPFEAAIWSEDSNQDGRNIIRHSIRIQKRYCDEAGSWKATDYVQPSEIADLILVSRSAFAYCRLKESDSESDVDR